MDDKDFKLKWEDFKLDSSKSKPFEIKDFTTEDITEQMKGASDFQKEMDKILKAHIRQVRNQKDKVIVEQIIDIYNHKYFNYDVYVAIMKAYIEKIKEINSKRFFDKSGDMKKEYYIEPTILSRNVFNTAYKLGKKRGEI